MDGIEKWVDTKTLISGGIGLVIIGGLLFWATRGRKGSLAGIGPGGTFVARRAKDSKLVIVRSSAVAEDLIRRPGGTPPEDYLALWWVPQSHAKDAKSAKRRVDQGWVYPVWVWERGATGQRGLLPIEGIGAGSMTRAKFYIEGPGSQRYTAYGWKDVQSVVKDIEEMFNEEGKREGECTGRTSMLAGKKGKWTVWWEPETRRKGCRHSRGMILATIYREDGAMSGCSCR